MQANKIKIEVSIKAPKATIWEYYTLPEHIVNWNFATEDWMCPTVTNDLKIGGIYNARMEAKDGSFGFDFIAVYDDIIPSNKLSYNMEDGRNATIFFNEENGTTKVTIIFDVEQTNSMELQQQGWLAILNNFKQYAEKNLD